MMDDEKLSFLKNLPQTNVQNDLANVFGGMFGQLTPHSKPPTIGPDAGWFKRWWHDHKLSRYASIAEKEAKIAGDNLQNAKDQQDALLIMLTFTQQLQDRFSEINHRQRMRDIEYQKGLYDIASAKADIEKKVAETRKVIAEAAVEEAEASKILRQIKGPRRVYDYEDGE